MLFIVVKKVEKMINGLGLKEVAVLDHYTVYTH
jgi:hypothetical protein